MYSAWSTSCISGIAAAVATIAYMVVDFSVSSMPELSSGWFIAGALVAALVVGGVVAIAVRGGLHLASCRHLALRSVLSIAAISLLLLGFLVTRPIETHAVLLDVKSGQSSSTTSVPPLIWIAIFGAILTPGIVSYAVGRLSRRNQVPPDR